MPKDRSERRTYRRSPGRQYGYEYDPLRSRTGQSRQQNQAASGISGVQVRAQVSNIPTRASGSLTQRPNLRRTRQLTRKSILESRRATLVEAEPQDEFTNDFVHDDASYEEPEDRTLYSSRRAAREAYRDQPNLPSTRQLLPDDDQAYQEAYPEEDNYSEDEWAEVDPDAGDEGYDDAYDEPDPLDIRMSRMRSAVVPAPLPERPVARRTRELDESQQYHEYDDVDDHYEEVERPRRGRRDEYEERDERPRRKSKKMSRRGLLFGLGAAAVGGAGIAAYELVPKIPSALDSAATNVEQQIQEAFNKGLAQGADNARREIIGSLENLEGFTLEGAIGAAKLTRVAYDVFVSPIITQGANITGDVLNAMLSAIKTARGVLAQSFLDNSTLQALQKVIQSWVDQVSNLPKQLNAITDTDLDGAQSYLKALQQKIADEKAQLNKSSTPTPTTKTK